ncbi:MAG: Brp/Blh family beta-carotene 15,15'-dioxygenase [Flavihumibacter sp.]|jgi:Brp/Blh family beta-carotene 15,15'-monooxygenase|nr:Brp/Blh family beta-carotene 15,15'-dioxygenase [Flavihumibacter sp.]
MKNSFIAIGLLLCMLHHWWIPIPFQVQAGILIIGFIFLGIPHGAADILVAKYQSSATRTYFSLRNFLLQYLLQILLFGLFLWIFPMPALLLFLCISAYHFGETDLKKIPADNWIGKLFISSYGLLILFFLLLTHIDEVVPILSLIDDTAVLNGLTPVIQEYQQLLLGILFIVFLVISFIFFSQQVKKQQFDSGNFLLRLALLLLILHQLPLLLGFSFYFIIWHSSLSLQSIITGLKNAGSYYPKKLIKHLLICSGIALAGTSFFLFYFGDIKNNNQILWYCFATLALLTAPHMLVMHRLYKWMRSN